MQSFRITLAYDGTDYSGWQYQPGRPTVQGAIEEALQCVAKGASRVIASGRTDAGVHAMGQVAAFRCDTRLAADTLGRALNANTPEDIHIWTIEPVLPSFHPIRDARAKRYRYTIQIGAHHDLFARRHAWHVPQHLDSCAMQSAAADLVGRHDFSSFESSGAPRKSAVRTVRELTLHTATRNQATSLIIEIEADGFLYKMVRNIVGTLVQIGLGKRAPDSIAATLANRDRRTAGPTAPPHGLFLWSVTY